MGCLQTKLSVPGKDAHRKKAGTKPTKKTSKPQKTASDAKPSSGGKVAAGKKAGKGSKTTAELKSPKLKISLPQGDERSDVHVSLPAEQQPNPLVPLSAQSSADETHENILANDLETSKSSIHKKLGRPRPKQPLKSPLNGAQKVAPQFNPGTSLASQSLIAGRDFEILTARKRAQISGWIDNIDTGVKYGPLNDPQNTKATAEREEIFARGGPNVPTAQLMGTALDLSETTEPLEFVRGDLDSVRVRNPSESVETDQARDPL